MYCPVSVFSNERLVELVSSSRLGGKRSPVLPLRHLWPPDRLLCLYWEDKVQPLGWAWKGKGGSIHPLLKHVDRFLPPAAKQDADVRLRGRILISFAFGLTAVIVLGWAARLTIGPLPLRISLLAIGCLSMLLGGPVLLQRGYRRLAGLLVTSALFAITFGAVWMAGGLLAPILSLAPILPFLTTILLDLRSGIVVGVAIALLCGVLLVPPHGLSGPLLLDSEGELKSRALLTVIACLMAVVLATFYDLQHRLGEQEKASTEARYQKIFQRSKEIIVLSNPDGKMLDANPAAVEFFGFTSTEDLLQASAKDFYADESVRDDLMSRLEAEGFVRDFESLLRLKDGRLRHVRGTTTVMRRKGGEIRELISILRDVTEELDAAREKEKVLERLAVKNDELERFAYTISHDLKSPLITIRGFLGLLQKDLASGRDGRVAKDVAAIERATHQMQHLLDDLLAYARMDHEADQHEPVCMSTLSGEVRELLSGRAVDAGIEVSLQADLPTVVGQPALLRMVWLNLLDNAIRYAEGRVEVGVREHVDDWHFFVGDDGPGLAPELHQKVFGLFETLDADSGGTGIGLASVQRAVEMHGGAVWIDSEPGAGARFWFSIPVSSNPEVVSSG